MSDNEREEALRLAKDARPEDKRFLEYLESDSPAVEGAWNAFNAALSSDDPDAPYPGMAQEFEKHFSQSFRDKDWRVEASVWAAAWKRATDLAAPQPQVSAAPAVAQEAVCNWTQEDIDGGYYDTGCGHAFSMLEGSDDPGAWMKFCCYCGRKAVVHPWEDPGDDDDATPPASKVQEN